MIESSVSDGLCILRLDAPPLNTITFPLLDELRAAIARANSDDRVRGIVITGSADHFSAGADINLFQQITSAHDAARISRLFQEAFQEVEASAKPVAAAVAGRVMGGALELAMACHVRVCTGGTKFSMPEVKLGFNPAAGGTQRLPRLVGVRAALPMLLTGRAVDAQEAGRLGLVDAVCPGESLVETAKGLLQSGSTFCPTSRRSEKIEDPGANDAAFQEAEKLLAGIRPEIIAPRKIVEAVKTGLEDSFAAGLLKEQEAFAACMDTLATRNKIYVFFATRQTSKVPGLAEARPGTIAGAAVIGMGSMGSGIVQALVTAGVPVVVCDQDDSALRKGMARIRSSVEKRVGQGKLSRQAAEEMLGRISPTGEWQAAGDADLVVEAVFEDVAVKRSVIARLEEVCSARTIIASNTSTISLDVLAEGMQHPERLIGMHFFNPAHRMPLVEVIRREGTPAGVIATAMQFAKALRKTPVLVKNREGFLVNRVFIPYFKEAFWLLEEGADPAAVDAAMVEFGFPMGPLVLIDMAGLDVLALTDEVMRRAFPRHGGLSPIALRLVEGGHLGQKTGSGVYKYAPGDYTPHHSEAAEAIIADVQRETGRLPGQLPTDQITRRLVLRMVNEAFYAIEEEIAQRQSDLDVAMVLGTGFPDFRGGVLKYAHDLGLENVTARLDELAARCGERFSPCRLLREMKGAG